MQLFHLFTATKICPNYHRKLTFVR